MGLGGLSGFRGFRGFRGLSGFGGGEVVKGAEEAIGTDLAMGAE